MLVKLMSKNRMTLPQEIISRVDPAVYFEATVENGRIILTPVPLRRAQPAQEEQERISDAAAGVEDSPALHQGRLETLAE